LFKIPGASKKLEEELVKYRIDIAAVQEIRWKLTEMVSLKEYILINSGSKKEGLWYRFYGFEML
jgi:hypothetical protein